MSNAVSKEKSKLFETILSSPGMGDKCKVSFVTTRQNILLLCHLIEAGLLTKEHGLQDELFQALSPDSLEEFKTLHQDILNKGGLASFYEKLRAL